MTTELSDLPLPPEHITKIIGMLRASQRWSSVLDRVAADAAAAERETWLSFAHEHADDDEPCCLRGAARWLAAEEKYGDGT